jgi:hypothetical protein
VSYNYTKIGILATGIKIEFSCFGDSNYQIPKPTGHKYIKKFAEMIYRK